MQARSVGAAFLLSAFICGVAACGHGAAISTPVPPLVPTPPPHTFSTVGAMTLSPKVILGDRGAAHAAFPLIAKDTSGSVIAGAFINPVTAAVSQGSPHTQLSIDGGATLASTVTLHNATDAGHLAAYYDGNGGSQYVASIKAAASGAGASTASLNTLTTTAIAAFGKTPLYTAGSARFTAPAQQLKITVAETNFTGTFSMLANSCGGVAAVTRSGATFTVTTSALGTCSITLGDGTLSYPIVVSSAPAQGPNPPPPGSATEYPDATPNLSPAAIAVGSDGNVWYVGTDGTNGYVARVTTAGAVTDFGLGAGSNPSAIVGGSDGNLWITDADTDSVYRVTTSGVKTGTFPVGNTPMAIALGSDGDVWVANSGADTVTCVTTSGSAATFAIPNSGAIQGIGAGPDGGVWVTDFLASEVSRVSPGCGSGGGTVTQYQTAAFSGNGGITAGPDGAVWFAQLFAGGVGRMSMTGAFTAYSDPGISPGGSITLGPDKNLWFGGCSCGIGRVTTSGTFTAFTSGITIFPAGIVAGPDGGIWFAGAGKGGAQVGRLQP